MFTGYFNLDVLKETAVMPETELEQNTDDVVVTTSDATEGVVETTSTDLAPGPDGNQAEVKEPTPEERQLKLEESLATQKFENRRERRERERAQDELARYQTAQANQTGNRPDIPELPDSFDDDFSEKMVARDTAIREAERFDARAEYGQQQQQYEQQQYQNQQAQEFQKTADTFKERASKLGISESDLRNNGERLLNSQALTESEIGMILSDEQGPAIAAFLANHPVELEKLASLPIGSSARMSMLLNDVKPKASALKAKTTSTVEPLDNISGGGGVKSSEYVDMPNGMGQPTFL